MDAQVFHFYQKFDIWVVAPVSFVDHRCQIKITARLWVNQFRLVWLDETLPREEKPNVPGNFLEDGSTTGFWDEKTVSATRQIRIWESEISA